MNSIDWARVFNGAADDLLDRYNTMPADRDDRDLMIWAASFTCRSIADAIVAQTNTEDTGGQGGPVKQGECDDE